MRNTVAQQKQIMRFMPIVFGFFLARFPAGLFVYWVASNLITFSPELHDLPPRPAPASPRGRPHGRPRRYHPETRWRERRASPENRRELDEEWQGEEQKEEGREQKEVMASHHSHPRRRRADRGHTGAAPKGAGLQHQAPRSPSPRPDEETDNETSILCEVLSILICTGPRKPPCLYIRSQLSIGPGLCELRRTPSTRSSTSENSILRHFGE